ncbi:MAG: hypothetical protein C0600_08165 [Ignavibacteria bacterium]|nr:MAG: hypothetical protein C0600_08165 [Ignavibacteria bacterium]
MNEQMQELITAYLHRGITPEQEKELFEACKNDPSVAEHLRQHLVLSLKLRRLRDDVTVSSALHASLERRLETIDLPEEQEDLQPVIMPERSGGFRLAHLFGTGVAAAAAAVVVMLLSRPEPGIDQPTATADAGTPADTVYVIERDTIRQVQEIERPVYIVKRVPVQDDATDPASPPAQEQLALHQEVEPTPGSPDPETAPETADIETAVPDAHGIPQETQDTPMFVDARPVATPAAEQKTQNYLDQYNAMLVSVESVQLTAQDRIAH